MAFCYLVACLQVLLVADTVHGYRLIYWNWEPKAFVEGHDDVISDGQLDFWDCSLRCLRQTDFECYSAEVGPHCISTSQTLATVDQDFYIGNDDYDHYNYEVIEEGTVQWKEFTETRSEFSDTAYEYTGVTLEVCKRKCQEEQAFICRSISFSPAKCFLSRLDSKSSIEDPAYNFYEIDIVGSFEWEDEEKRPQDSNVPVNILEKKTREECKKLCNDNNFCEVATHDFTNGNCRHYPSLIGELEDWNEGSVYTEHQVEWTGGYQCNGGWHRRGNTCYKAFCSELPFSEAATQCSDAGSTLAIITEFAEILMTARVAKDNQYSCAGTDTWIGLYSVGTAAWRWVDGSWLTDEIESGEFPWDADEGYPFEDLCAYIPAKKDAWKTVSCTDYKAYVCQRPVSPLCESILQGA